MRRAATVPFQIAFHHQVISGTSVTTTTDQVDGLLRLDGADLLVQWRVTQVVEQVGLEIREDRAVAGVRELTMPIAGLTATTVKPRWWHVGQPLRLMLTAPDLRRFEGISGPEGLRLEHPAQLVLDIRPADRLAAQEFAAELELAVAEAVAQREHRLPRPGVALDPPATPTLPATSPETDG